MSHRSSHLFQVAFATLSLRDHHMNDLTSKLKHNYLLDFYRQQYLIALKLIACIQLIRKNLIIQTEEFLSDIYDTIE